jgi:glycosyltransferase involved in cell wall biosynthesis
MFASMEHGSSVCRDDMLAVIYNASDMYISAGIDDGAEGLPLTVLEAMAAGLPILATNISGNMDVIQNEVNGYLIPPSDPSNLADTVIKLLKK